MLYRNKIILLFVLLIGLGAVLYFSPLFTKRTAIFPPRQQAVDNTPLVTQVASDQLPGGFPEGVFVPPDGVLVENTNTTFPDGRFWATRIYETSADLEALQKDYETYIQSLEGWSFPQLYARGESDIYLFSQKDQSSLVIYLRRDKDKSLADISLVTKK